MTMCMKNLINFTGLLGLSLSEGASPCGCDLLGMVSYRTNNIGVVNT